MPKTRYEAGFGMPEGPAKEFVKKFDQQIVWSGVFVAVILLIVGSIFLKNS